jgi:biopolymer transport protein ExbD
MRKRTWRAGFNHGHVELNVIPLIDVVFFLLVFYVISTSFAPEAGVVVERPSSTRAQSLGGDFVPVAVTRAGLIQVGPRSTDLAGLPAVVDDALRSGSATRVLVIADREVSTGLLLQIMDACSAGGAAEVEVAATREGG